MTRLEAYDLAASIFKPGTKVACGLNLKAVGYVKDECNIHVPPPHLWKNLEGYNKWRLTINVEIQNGIEERHLIDGCRAYDIGDFPSEIIKPI